MVRHGSHARGVFHVKHGRKPRARTGSHFSPGSPDLMFYHLCVYLMSGNEIEEARPSVHCVPIVPGADHQEACDARRTSPSCRRRPPARPSRGHRRESLSLLPRRSRQDTQRPLSPPSHRRLARSTAGEAVRCAGPLSEAAGRNPGGALRRLARDRLRPSLSRRKREARLARRSC